MVSHWDANHNQRIEYNFLGTLNRWFIVLQIANSGYNLYIVQSKLILYKQWEFRYWKLYFLLVV